MHLRALGVDLYGQDMKKFATTLGVLAILLTGCAAAEPAPTPTPTPEPPANAEPCENFGDLIANIPTAVNSDNSDQWDDLREQFDEVALAAEGVTQDRMLGFVEDWPEFIDVALWNEVDVLNGGIEGVQRACIADDVDVAFDTLTTGE